MQSRNYDQIHRPNPGDETIAQWPGLDQKKLMRSDLGIDADSLLELTADRPDPEGPWDEHRFGSQKSRLDLFRSMILTGAEIPVIMQNERPNLQCFPFSMWKPGADEPGLTAEDEIAKYDISTMQGVNFSHADMTAAFARYAAFLRCRFFNTILTDLIADGVRFVNCIFRNVEAQRATLDGVVVSGFEARKAPINFSGLTIVNSDFTRASLKNHKLTDSTISDSNFSDSDFLTRDSKAINLSGSIIQNSNFYGAKADLYHSHVGSTAGRIRACDFTQAQLNAEFYVAVQCIFDLAVFSTLSFRSNASVAKSSFINADFPAGVDFSGVDVRGCDFSGSNIDSRMAQAGKSAFRSAVATYDAETIWTDGTPLSE